MPQKKASMKDVRQIKKKTEKNRLILRNIKELIKDASHAANAGDMAKAQEFARKLQKAVDKAAKVGILKANTAARKKSRLSVRLKKVGKK
jgi:small subunit ribosomal protein S20